MLAIRTCLIDVLARVSKKRIQCIGVSVDISFSNVLLANTIVVDAGEWKQPRRNRRATSSDALWSGRSYEIVPAFLLVRSFYIPLYC